MLDINITAIIQVVNFFIAIIVLNFLLIRPIREILKQRKVKMDDMLASAEGFNASAAGQLADYQTSLARARQEAVAARTAARAEALNEQQTLVNAASKNAQEQFAKARQSILAEMENAKTNLSKQVKPLAAKAAEKFLA